MKSQPYWTRVRLSPTAAMLIRSCIVIPIRAAAAYGAALAGEQFVPWPNG